MKRWMGAALAVAGMVLVGCGGATPAAQTVTSTAVSTTAVTETETETEVSTETVTEKLTTTVTTSLPTVAAAGGGKIPADTCASLVAEDGPMLRLNDAVLLMAEGAMSAEQQQEVVLAAADASSALTQAQTASPDSWSAHFQVLIDTSDTIVQAGMTGNNVNLDLEGYKASGIAIATDCQG